MKVRKEEIKQRRIALDLTAEEMAKKMQVTPQCVHRIERVGVAGRKSIKRIARIYGVDYLSLVIQQEKSAD